MANGYTLADSRLVIIAMHIPLGRSSLSDFDDLFDGLINKIDDAPTAPPVRK